MTSRRALLKFKLTCCNTSNAQLDKYLANNPFHLPMTGTLPDELQTDCSKCSDRQKSASARVIHFLIDSKKKEWEKLEAKYDPTGAYRIKYEAQEMGGDVSVAPATE
jgi:hypothetical protein